jgi:CheY-like chemotaxis protein
MGELTPEELQAGFTVFAPAWEGCSPRPVRKILVVDDDLSIVGLLSRAIQRMGDYRVLEADSGRRAVEVARAERPDLILLDMLMPQMDGMAVCRALRGAPKTREIPVIFLTGFGDGGAWDAARESGAQGCIDKSCGLRRLRSILRRFIGLVEQGGEGD